MKDNQIGTLQLRHSHHPVPSSSSALASFSAGAGEPPPHSLSPPVHRTPPPRHSHMLFSGEVKKPSFSHFPPLSFLAGATVLVVTQLDLHAFGVSWPQILNVDPPFPGSRVVWIRLFRGAGRIWCAPHCGNETPHVLFAGSYSVCV